MENVSKLLLRGGKVVNADSSTIADVYCEFGKIAQVGPNLDIQDSSVKVVDVSGKILVPGGIDPHTHFHLPFMGTIAADHFEGGTRAAVAGGTTTVIDFVIPAPGESLLKAYDTWKEWAEEAVCDYSFHVAITWWSDQVKEEMGIVSRERGVNSFKHFMAYKGSLMLNDEALVNSFTRAKELGCIATENGELVLRAQQKLLAQGVTGPEGHPWSRPPAYEAEATNRACTIANAINTPVYIVHVSCKEALEHIATHRQAGWKVFGEALAGHLTIDDSVYFKDSWEESAAHVMSPPFRAKGHQEALWGGLQSGALQTTATDNCTFCGDQKKLGAQDFTKIPNGTNGVEDRMSILWHHGVNSGKLTENQYVAVTSTNAAQLFNMYPKKGVIAVGSDADITVIDPNVERTISATTMHQANGHNIWEGWTVKGVTVITVSRGEVVWEAKVENGVAQWDQGTFNASKGRGKYVFRPTFGTAFKGITEREEMNGKKPIVRG